MIGISEYLIGIFELSFFVQKVARFNRLMSMEQSLPKVVWFLICQWYEKLVPTDECEETSGPTRFDVKWFSFLYPF